MLAGGIHAANGVFQRLLKRNLSLVSKIKFKKCLQSPFKCFRAVAIAIIYSSKWEEMAATSSLKIANMFWIKVVPLWTSGMMGTWSQFQVLQIRSMLAISQLNFMFLQYDDEEKLQNQRKPMLSAESAFPLRKWGVL